MKHLNTLPHCVWSCLCTLIVDPLSADQGIGAFHWPWTAMNIDFKKTNKMSHTLMSYLPSRAAAHGQLKKPSELRRRTSTFYLEMGRKTNQSQRPTSLNSIHPMEHEHSSIDISTLSPTEKKCLEKVSKTDLKVLEAEKDEIKRIWLLKKISAPLSIKKAIR